MFFAEARDQQARANLLILSDSQSKGTECNTTKSPCQNHVFRVRTNRETLLPEFLALISASPYGKRFFILNSKQSTNLASINSTQLKGFPIFCPSIAEQKRIIDVLSAIDEYIQTEQTKKRKFEQTKTGLMQDLLTGRVRVGGVG